MKKQRKIASVTKKLIFAVFAFAVFSFKTNAMIVGQLQNGAPVITYSQAQFTTDLNSEFQNTSMSNIVVTDYSLTQSQTDPTKYDFRFEFTCNVTGISGQVKIAALMSCIIDGQNNIQGDPAALGEDGVCVSQNCRPGSCSPIWEGNNCSACNPLPPTGTGNPGDPIEILTSNCTHSNPGDSDAGGIGGVLTGHLWAIMTAITH